MRENGEVKENIINTTIELINECQGDIGKITMRKIAEKADVGLGLINYYFGSKNQLITICVQKIISNVIACFSPDLKEYGKDPESADRERVADWAKQVYDFLFEHKAISRISIMEDMKDYQVNSNSMCTQRGFSTAIRGSMDEKDKRLLTFILTSSMQVAFLAEDVSQDILGYDFSDKKQRDSYIDSVVEMLFHGALGK